MTGWAKPAAMAASSIPAARMLSFVFIILFEFLVQFFPWVLREICGEVPGNLCRVSRPFPGSVRDRPWTLCCARPSGKPVGHIRVFITHCFDTVLLSLL